LVIVEPYEFRADLKSTLFRNHRGDLVVADKQAST